ncbi:MAG: hypothetical protein JNK66_11550, partial [Chitinophagales bacterium]|nr:hypothetical protein [Chitinophagales bacterium]
MKNNSSLLFTYILLQVVCTQSIAQKEDYTWFSGYDSYAGLPWGTNVQSFTIDSMHVTYDSLGMNFARTNTSYCNSDGNPMFYTNGIHIRNGLDEIVEESWGMNEGQFIVQFDPTIEQKGYRVPQGIVALQNPSNPEQYYLLHTFWDTSATLGSYPKRLLYTLLDMSQNAGHGKVLAKNQVIIENFGGIGTEISVCRHANGRDWWVLTNQRETNCFYRTLIDHTGIHAQPNKVCTGSIVPINNITSSAFSPNGSKFAYLSLVEGATVFDFDRCEGLLSNPVQIPIGGLLDSGWWSLGTCISPNNRFLYVGITQYVLQYDLQDPDIAASVDTVAIYDGFQAPFGSFFHTMQLGPDGKIYESCGNGERVYHVIEQPDKKGDSCMFKQHHILLPTYSAGVPNFPNYRLGALPNSPCDTLGTSISQPTTRNPQLTIFPNPATEFVVID